MSASVKPRDAESVKLREASIMRVVPRTVVAAMRMRGIQVAVSVVVGGVLCALFLTSHTGVGRSLMFGALGVFLVVILGAIYFQPQFATDAFEWYEPRVQWRIRTSEPVAALTIDDVPFYNTSRLEEILQILRGNGARATLFVMSACLSEAPEAARLALKDAVEEGLVELGNHGAYDEPAVGLEWSDFERKHDHCERLLESLQGVPKRKWFRPGSGLVNGRILDWCAKRGYTCVLGNCYPHDPADITRFVNAAYLRRRVRNGAIVLIHDRWHTPDTLRAYFRSPARVRLTTLSEATAVAELHLSSGEGAVEPSVQ